MKIAVLTSRYPSKHKPYNHTFVHNRNSQYLASGHEVEVFVPADTNNDYVHENVHVNCDTAAEITKKLSDFDIIFIHLLYPNHKTALDGRLLYNHISREKLPCLFFVHGVETSKRREVYSGGFRLSPLTYAKYWYWDVFIVGGVRKAIKSLLSGHNTQFVFPSNWIKNKSEENFEVDYSGRFDIIPNGIDTNRFSFQDHSAMRKKVLSIRPVLLKSIYGIDLFVETIAHANKEIIFDLYGEGKDSDQLNRLIKRRKLGKVFTFHNQFIANADIPEVHSEYGIYYAVTRTDTQGVSMCEAMASGLPVVSYDVGAIAEFVEHGVSGFLAPKNDVESAAKWINELAEDKNLFLKVAENGRKRMEAIAIGITVQKELDAAKKSLISYKQ